MNSSLREMGCRSLALLAASLLCVAVPLAKADAAVVYDETGTLDCADHANGVCHGGNFYFGVLPSTLDPIGPEYVRAGSYEYSFTVYDVGDIQITANIDYWIWGTNYSPYLTFIEQHSNGPDQRAVYSSTGVTGTFTVGPHFDTLSNGIGSVGDAFAGVGIHLLIPDDDPIFPTRYELRINSIPEPATWALMMMGFLGLGAALRRQRGRFAPAERPGVESAV